MYFWRIKELVSQLEVRSLSERENVRYYFADSLLVAIGGALPNTDWNVWDQAGAITSIVVTCAGIVFCYRANGGASGESFLSRILAVSWVMTIRFIVFGMAAALVAVGVQAALGRLSEATTWWDVLFLTGFEVLLYVRVAHHLRRIRDRRALLAEARESAPQVQLAPLA